LELSQDIPSSDPADQGDEEDWDTVGGATERSLSPAPAVEEVVPEPAQQATGAGEPQTEERRLESSTTTGTMEPVVAQAEEEAPAEAGLIDIASILGALTVTVVRSSL
jgi:predicted secreted protein